MSGGSSLHDLKQVICSTLERRGVLDNITARVRAEVFKSLDDPDVQKPRLSNENVLINELIREYLEYNHYKYAASVLQAESGQAELLLDRSFLNSELHVTCTPQTDKLPLLYSLVNHFKEEKAASLHNPHSHQRQPHTHDQPAKISHAGFHATHGEVEESVKYKENVKENV